MICVVFMFPWKMKIYIEHINRGTVFNGTIWLAITREIYTYIAKPYDNRNKMQR